jgi:4-hydroxy-tetrahydrodipicolinate reductase
MKKKKIAVVGASGRMGQEIAQMLLQSKDLEPTLGIVRSGEAKLFKTTAKDLSAKNFAGIDAIIDFSSVEAFSKVLNFAKVQQIPLVSGVTGLSTAQHKELSKVAKAIPVLWAPNMSLGVAALSEALKALSGVAHFDFQIEEFHHSRKKDKPSGTAIHLQKTLEKAVGKKCPEPVSVRGGGIFGIHKIYAMSENEVIEMGHTALNRKLFAEGSLEAARWLISKKPGLYELGDILQK